MLITITNGLWGDAFRGLKRLQDGGRRIHEAITESVTSIIGSSSEPADAPVTPTEKSKPGKSVLHFSGFEIWLRTEIATEAETIATGDIGFEAEAKVVAYYVTRDHDGKIATEAIGRPLKFDVMDGGMLNLGETPLARAAPEFAYDMLSGLFRKKRIVF
jgi:hypothetical protein